MTNQLDSLLRKYAEVIVRVGLNLQPGQRLLINGPSWSHGVAFAAAPLVRQIAVAAYQAGARFVAVHWGDEDLHLIRFQHAPRDSFSEYPAWQMRAAVQYAEQGDVYLAVRANDPDLFKGQDPALVATAQQAALQHFHGLQQYTARNDISWCVVGATSPAWAAKVFPELPAEAQVDALWQALFTICRVHADDPVAAWQAHLDQLEARSRYLNEKRYSALKLRAPGTDLTLGLAPGHVWKSALGTNKRGARFVANLPTEEVYTLPDRNRAEGTVRAALPLSYAGTLIEDFSVTFRDGRVVDVTAKRGEALLRQLIETDEGANRLGEIALVPHGSPISRMRRLFYDILIDENAASHIALGNGYKITMQGGATLTDEEFTQAGGNLSKLHADFMIGSQAMDIDGVSADGATEPVMRQGEWAARA